MPLTVKTGRPQVFISVIRCKDTKNNHTHNNCPLFYFIIPLYSPTFHYQSKENKKCIQHSFSFINPFCLLSHILIILNYSVITSPRCPLSLSRSIRILLLFCRRSIFCLVLSPYKYCLSCVQVPAPIKDMV